VRQAKKSKNYEAGNPVYHRLAGRGAAILPYLHTSPDHAAAGALDDRVPASRPLASAASVICRGVIMRTFLHLAASALLMLPACSLATGQHITSPQEHLGRPVGVDFE
jgi:hypothetical protein